MSAFLDRLRRRMREFRAADGANVTITFAIALIPMVGFVGAAIDYSHANSVKAAMQAAADSTALMLSKTAASLSPDALQTQANNYFQALFNRPEAKGLTVQAIYTTTNGSQLKVIASASVKTDFMGVMGLPSLNVSVDSQVKWGNSRLRVALVLDNTGSMASAGKMAALKTATNKLLDQLKNAAVNDGDVYVSIIPFVKDVNVDPANYKAPWIYWDDALQTDPNSWDAKNGKCSVKGSGTSTRSGCKLKGGHWTPNNHKTWTGCVMDRGSSLGPSVLNTDTNVTPPNALLTDTLFAAEQYGSCPQPVMPLNYDWTAMKALVNNMSPSGMTNQGIGLVHGWLSLVGGGPYPTPPPEDPSYKYSKVIILMTDGLNTQNRWYSSQSKIDARQKLTCDNVKAAGITLYTIQVNTDGDPTSTLLRDCASGPDKFFLLTSASQLVTTFQQIGTALSNLRISQ